MTVEEDGKTEEAGTKERPPKLGSNISPKGLFASFRERGEDVGSTPEVASPRTPAARGRGVVGGYFSPKSASPVGLDLNPLKTNLSKFLTPSRTFSRLREEKEELSRLTPSPPSHGFTLSFNLPLIGEVKPRHLLDLAKEWLRSPKNLALLIWGIAVGISGAILFMVMTGMLNAVLPDKSARNTWFEVSNQIINALFTLMVLYLHPQRCLHFYMLWRWRASDIVNLRDIYCKNGTRKPHEWGHILVVVLLLQLNCIAQYALCGLNWGYRRAERPAIGVAICLCLSLGGAAGAGLYNIVSPLGKDFDDPNLDPEDPEKEVLETLEHEFAPRTRIYRMLERRVSFASRQEGVLVESPEWKGGIFDVTNEPAVSILSAFCCVCVFGWNMDRLGFGNRFVHIVTFVLICSAPFWIFDLAALNIANRFVRHAIGYTGIALCAFGLFYGGYWRIRMRETFKLPASRFCCGWPGVTDCFQWLFCPVCSLCQEVRTAESYDIKDDRFYSRKSQVLPSSPPSGLASPHTPVSSTLPAVQEMGEMNLVDVELRGHDSPYQEIHHPKSPLVPPTPVTASRGTTNGIPGLNSLTMSPLQSSPSSPRSSNPFLNPAAAGESPSRNLFAPLPSESPSHTSTATNPFLQRHELYSRGAASPLRSPPPFSSPSYNSQADLTSQASEALTQCPLLSPNRVSSPINPFSPPEMSPLHHHPFHQPETSNSASGADHNPSFPSASPPRPGSTNPFLHSQAVHSPSESIHSSK
ncbi:unnamed protein product [Calypogeia fissa]